MITKTDFDAKLQAIIDRVTKYKSKHLLAEIDLTKLKTFDEVYFRGKNYVEYSGTLIYLVFQPINKYFKKNIGVGNDEYIYFWKSRGFSGERINSITSSNYMIASSLDYLGATIKVKFSRSCLRQDKITYTHGKIVNIYIVYEICKNYNISNYPTLQNCLFGVVSLNKNADIDQYKYSGYGIGFDRKGEFSFGSRRLGRNVIIFGVDLSSYSHANNKKNNTVATSKDFVQEINGTTIYAEGLYKINFTSNNKKFVLSLHYN